MRLRHAFATAALVAGLVACAAPDETPRAASAVQSSVRSGAAAGWSDGQSGAVRINDGPDQNRIIPAQVPTIAALVPERVRATGKLTIGVGAAGAGFPPLAFTATDNKTLIGSEPDLAVAIAGVLGLEPDLQNTSWENLFVGLDSGRYDVGASNITVTELRKQKYDFATYRLDNLAFEAKTGAGWKVTGPRDVAGKKIAVGSGTNQEKTLVEWSEADVAAGLPAVDVKYYQTNQATYLALGSGQIDAYLGPNPTVAYHVAVAGQTEAVTGSEVNPVGLPIDGK